jgi:hypothetical protein
MRLERQRRIGFPAKRPPVPLASLGDLHSELLEQGRSDLSIVLTFNVVRSTADENVRVTGNTEVADSEHTWREITVGSVRWRLPVQAEQQQPP